MIFVDFVKEIVRVILIAVEKEIGEYFISTIGDKIYKNYSPFQFI
jgi:hypothetical protein